MSVIPSMNKPALTLFYDGFCPLCEKEIRYLRKKDTHQRMLFIDINSEIFVTQFPQLDWQRLYDRIHAIDDKGVLISGLDVNYRAWQIIGRGWMFAPLRWPIISWFADKAYVFFARHRHTIAYLLTGQKRCKPCDAKSVR